MVSPVQAALDAVDMQPIADARASADGIPHATHSGVLELGPLKLPVFRLSDGRAVISEEGMAAFLEFLGV